MIETHCANRAEHEAFLQRPELVHARQLEQYLAQQNHDRTQWFLSGFCRACERPAEFLVDRQWGGQLIHGTWIPAWRERVECLRCHLNNRQRLVASHLRDALATRSQGAHVYLTEAITLFGQWAQESIQGAEVIGSEYLPDEQARAYLPPQFADTRHEDVTALSFDDDSLDVIVTNDVLEHVPTPGDCFREMVRVLRPGGQLIMTVPMDVTAEGSVIRARLRDGQVEHLMEPVYHGNPVAADEGSLVFTDFGWDILDRLRSAGFAESSARATWSALYGHLGPPQVVIFARA